MSDKPLFPNFKSIDIADRESIENFTWDFPPYSDFNFVSLWSYDTDNDVLFSWLNENFVMRFRDYITKDYFYTFLGNNKTKETIITLLELSKNQNLPQELKLIPEDSIISLNNDDKKLFSVIEDIDQNDYIIPLDKTATLENINPHKQESYKKFLDQNPNFEFREIDITEKAVQESMIKLFNKWVEIKGGNFEDAENELLAMKKLFEYSRNFTLISHGLFIENELICYIIDQRLQKPYVLGHFLKADINFKGVYEVINKLTAEAHLKEGYQYINIEQDLGIEGLRISKKQRSPIKYLKKYTITPKT